MKKIDIITPCFNEENCVALFYKEVTRVLSAIGCAHTVIFVDDGSADGTLSEIKKLVSLHGKDKVKYISFSRNFGKESAIYAGLKSSTGDLVALLDSDLQDPPDLLPLMFDVINQGYESYAVYRKDRKGELAIRSFFSDCFYRLFNSVSPIKMKPGARDFRLMTRKMVDAVVSLGETNRFTKGLFEWVGFKTKWLAYDNTVRISGKSKFSFFSLIKYAINGIVSFSDLPLKIASFIGFITVFIGFIYMAYVFTRTIFFGVRTSGFATTIILFLIIGGIIITLLGIIGEYIARIYQEIKRRPIYIARETNIDNTRNKVDEANAG